MYDQLNQILSRPQLNFHPYRLTVTINQMLFKFRLPIALGKLLKNGFCDVLEHKAH